MGGGGRGHHHKRILYNYTAISSLFLTQEAMERQRQCDTSLLDCYSHLEDGSTRLILSPSLPMGHNIKHTITDTFECSVSAE